MKTLTLSLILPFAAALAPISQAAIVVYEPFDYLVGSNIGTVAASGTGLTGNWRLSFSSGGPATLNVSGYTDWDLPSGYQYAPLDKRVGTPDDQTNSAAVNLAPAAQIDFDQDGVFYYSYLLSYGTDNRSRVSFGSSSTPDLMRVQGIAGGTLRVYAGGDYSAGGALAADADYLVVGRITTSALGNDEHRIWVYADDQTVALSDPGTIGSYAARTDIITGTASMLQFSNVIDASYGTFVMGTTWEAVVVPEPSTYAALLGASAFIFILARRRMRRPE